MWSVNDGLSIYLKPVGNLPKTCQKLVYKGFWQVSGGFWKSIIEGPDGISIYNCIFLENELLLLPLIAVNVKFFFFVTYDNFKGAK